MLEWYHTNSIKSIKYIDTNTTKYVQVLYTENQKILLREKLKDYVSQCLTRKTELDVLDILLGIRLCIRGSLLSKPKIYREDNQEMKFIAGLKLSSHFKLLHSLGELSVLLLKPSKRLNKMYPDYPE